MARGDLRNHRKVQAESGRMCQLVIFRPNIDGVFGQQRVEPHDLDVDLLDARLDVRHEALRNM